MIEKKTLEPKFIKRQDKMFKTVVSSSDKLHF